MLLKVIVDIEFIRTYYIRHYPSSICFSSLDTLLEWFEQLISETVDVIIILGRVFDRSVSPKTPRVTPVYSTSSEYAFESHFERFFALKRLHVPT